MSPRPLSALEAHFEDNLKRGIVLSAKELRDYAEKNKLPVPPWSELRQFRHKWKSSAFFSNYRKPAALQGPSVYKYGCLQIDYAEYRPDLKRANGNCGGFILGVETLSKQLACVPTKDKTAASWRMAVKRMLETKFEGITVIYSDRDSAASSKFRAAVLADFGVSWEFLRNRTKAFLVERYIKYCKEHFSIGLASNPGNFNWTRFITPTLDRFNSQKIPGTDMKRKDVSKTNYMRLVSTLFNVEDPDVVTNIASSSNLSPRVQKALFKFKVGDLVVVLRKSQYVKGEKKTTFEKPTTKGYFGSKTYKVVKLILKSNWKLSLVPVYALSSLHGSPLQGYFYSAELRKVGYRDDGPENEGGSD
jgi:hypothetical protein